MTESTQEMINIFELLKIIENYQKKAEEQLFTLNEAVKNLGKKGIWYFEDLEEIIRECRKNDFLIDKLKEIQSMIWVEK